MTHLAIDLGSTSGLSEGVLFDPQDPSTNRSIRFQTDHASIRVMVDEYHPSVVIIESCRTAHWVFDLLSSLGVQVLVANTNSEEFQMASRRRKTDRLDAERLMHLFLLGNLKTVHMRTARSRHNKQLLELRKSVVDERTALKNQIRHHLDGVGLVFKPGKSGWTKRSLTQLHRWIEEAPDGIPGGHWQSILQLYLERFDRLEKEIAHLNALLDQLEEADSGAQQLRTVPGIGLMTALAVAASIDDPKRFASAKKVSRFSGFDPVPHQSGKKETCKGISRRSWSFMRGYLYEACQIGIHRCKDPWFQMHYQRLKAQTGSARNAICAIARRVYVLCWRMLRNNQTWSDVTAASLKAAQS